MVNPLSDYFIESNSRVMLHYTDGSSKRVSVKSLSKHVNEADLAKITKALSLHKGFTDKVLPPWVKVVLLAACLCGATISTTRVAGTVTRYDPEPSVSLSETSATAPTEVQPSDPLEHAVDEAKALAAPLLGQGDQSKTKHVESTRSDEGNAHANDDKSQRDKEKHENNGKSGKSD